ncbi:MAG: hypothetical protein QMD53_03190 [Actinomycetota bacterium]|nr:hypothetical protein [Actinomycetota bacterium]
MAGDPTNFQKDKEGAWNKAMDEAANTAQAAGLGAVAGGLAAAGLGLTNPVVGTVGIGAGVGFITSEIAQAAGEASVDTAGPALEEKITREAVEMKKENPDMPAAEALRIAREQNTQK